MSAFEPAIKPYIFMALYKNRAIGGPNEVRFQVRSLKGHLAAGGCSGATTRVGLLRDQVVLYSL
jgi:hypothetical protein